MSDVYNIFPKRAAEPLLLETKITFPRLGSNIILRDNLTEKLHQGIYYNLTLVTAPAGYGKSTLVAKWASQSNIPVAWLSLDENDNDVAAFWSYFISALKNIHPQFGQQSLEFLHSSSLSLLEKILTIFLNEINRNKHDFAIVLDDFHVIKDPDIYSTFQYLLEHLPPQFHVYIITRVTPTLPLASFRAKGKLLEIGANELLFTFKESELYFKKIIKSGLRRQEIQLLHQRMEGWVAGLQMAGILIKEATDQTGFIREFSGNHRHIMDYFLEEILVNIPDMVRNFLMQTSVLTRMNSNLCSVLTGKKNCQEILEWLEQYNLFIIPMDGENRWYRYHHLFAEVLKTVLHEKDPDGYKNLHLKAGKWFKENGFNGEAIYHALEGSHYEILADWIEEEAPRCFQMGELSKLTHWICSLPQNILTERPRLWLNYIWILIVSGKIKEAELSCAKLVRFINKPGAEFFFKDGTSVDYLKSETQILESCLSFYRGEMDAAEKFVEALASKHQGSLLMEGNILLNVYSASLLQTGPGMWGKLQFAVDFFTSTEAAVVRAGENPSLAFGYTILGEIFYECNNLAKSYQFVQKALRLCQHEFCWGNIVPAYLLAAKIKKAQGEDDTAIELLNVIEKRINNIELLHWISVINANRARMAIIDKNNEKVSRWVEECDLSVDDEVTLLQHYQYTTLVRALLYLNQPAKALLLADRMVVLLEGEGGIGQQIEMLLLQSFCCQALNLMGRALSSLREAVQLGAAEDYYRVFIDEGEGLLKLLKALKAQHVLLQSEEQSDELVAYSHRLCESIIQENRTAEKYSADSSSEITAALTNREWDVLKLLSMGFSNQAIADSLFISVVTVKTHVQNVCRKLNVKSRAKAIARINELDLRNCDRIQL